MQGGVGGWIGGSVQLKIVMGRITTTQVCGVYGRICVCVCVCERERERERDRERESVYIWGSGVAVVTCSFLLVHEALSYQCMRLKLLAHEA